MKEYLDKAGLQEYTEKLVTKLKTIFPGQPLVASTATDMTDTSRIYVYTGSETGYTAGNWYYYDTTSGTWESGGAFISGGIETDTTLSVPGMAADAKAAGDAIRANAAALANKANVDGSYESMTVGNAEQLVSTVGVEDQVPYNFRASGGGADIGDRETDMVVGGTLAWNQIVAQGDMTDATKWSKTNCTLSCADNVGTFVRTDLTQTGRILANQGGGAYNNQPYKADHKVLICADLKADALTSGSIALRYKAEDVASIKPDGYTAGTWKYTATIKTWDTGSDTTYVQVFDYRTEDEGEGLNKVYVKNVMLFDLTQMFGATIADYVYSLEQANAGDGVAWFRKLFPNDYYAYDAGTLRSVNVSSHNLVGFNAWDEEWEVGTISSTTGQNTTGDAVRSKNYIPVVPGATYYLRMPSSPSSLSIRLFFYDADKNFMSYTDKYVSNAATNAFSMPDDCGFMRFRLSGDYGTTYHNDICINLSWDGERDGEYEPYQAWNYPLDDSLTLRGIPTLDANNKLRYDGDTYASNGTVNRRYGIVTLDGVTAKRKINQVGQSSASGNPYYGSISALEVPAKGYAHFITSGGVVASGGVAVPGGAYITGAGILYMFNNDQTITTVDAWNAWLQSNPITIVYELATPTTETADPYTNPQIVSDWGTEEYVDAGVEAGARDVAIPVGHKTFYQANLRAKLEAAPDSPDGDGDYIVRQSNGENVYVPLVIPDELPDAPGEDGTYVLHATVLDGVPTYSWVAAT